MNNIPFHLVISGVFFQFEDSSQVEELVELLFYHANDRRELYERILLDGATVTSHLLEEAGEEGQKRAATIIAGMKIVVDRYGKVYDPGMEIMKISACEESL